MPDNARSLEHRVGTAIRGQPHLRGLSVHIETRQGRVILHGLVNSYFQKQIAQEALRTVDGVAEIENQLEVVEV